MKYLNFRLWGPFYVIGLAIVMLTMWMVDEVRPGGIALWLGSVLICILVGFNLFMMRNEIKAHEKKEDKDRILSGLEPIDRNRKGFLSRKEKKS